MFGLYCRLKTYLSYRQQFIKKFGICNNIRHFSSIIKIQNNLKDKDGLICGYESGALILWDIRSG
jgi:hypothetical protein